MRLRLLAIGSRPEPWVGEGFDAYARRLPREWRLEVVEIPLGRRAGGSDAAARDEECARLERLLKPGEYVVALDERGRSWSSVEFAREVGQWLEKRPSVALVVGGPEGLSDSLKKRADRLWSLSPQTFPHGLVRVLVAEQLYRAWTILNGHPYHKP